MVAFAGNSVLARIALANTDTGPAMFSIVRLASGAGFLWLYLRIQHRGVKLAGDRATAFALFVYVVAFSYAYLQLSAGAGALILFGTVQATMLLVGWARGSRFNRWQWSGFALACAGVVGLLSPGATAPDPASAVIMAGAGIAWGIYSLRPGTADPVATSAGNFVRTLPLCLLLLALSAGRLTLDPTGLAAAMGSGIITSGVGYVLWYSVLPHLSIVNASTIQLSVPAIAAVMGTAFLNEPVTTRLVAADLAVLIGIAAVLRLGRPTVEASVSGAAQEGRGLPNSEP